MPPISKPRLTPIKPLSFEAGLSLRDDEQFLRWLTFAEPIACECVRRPHFWQCEYCSLICSSSARPACPIGAAV